MKRFMLAAAGLLLLCGFALASGQTTLMTGTTPFRWSGLYFGANGGAAWNQKCWTYAGHTNSPDLENEGCHTPSGGVLGGQVGFNWQPAGSPWVFGVEGRLGLA